MKQRTRFLAPLTCWQKCPRIQAAYGEGHLKPKHHYCFHNAESLASSKSVVLDCWVHERKHQMLKQVQN